MVIKVSLLCVCSILITGCGLKKFDCPYTDGVSCKSLTEVNQMVDRGEQGTKHSKSKTKVKEDFMNQETLGLDKTLEMPIESREPQRIPEKIVRIWLAPYESVDGTFHQQTFINTVVMPAHWVEGA
jgi:conjugal transfer pilus assembly protein TraV